MKKIKMLLFVLLGMSVASYAQKIKLIEGDLSFLKGQTSIKREFTYDNMLIGGKGKTEEEYIAEKKKTYDEKEPGKGDQWAKAWVADRKSRFEPRFNELFDETSELKNDANAKYTLILKTTRTEPGFNVGIMRQSAFIDSEAWFVETGNPSKVLAKVSMIKAPGRDAFGYDFDSGVRIQEGYEKTGKTLGGFVKKAMKK
jgi:hypothetical protein